MLCGFTNDVVLNPWHTGFTIHLFRAKQTAYACVCAVIYVNEWLSSIFYLSSVPHAKDRKAPQQESAMLLLLMAQSQIQSIKQPSSNAFYWHALVTAQDKLFAALQLLDRGTRGSDW